MSSAFRLTALDFMHPVDTNCGIDGSDELGASIEEQAVTVPENQYTLSPSDMQRLQSTIDPLILSDNYAIELYEQCVLFLNSI